MKINKLFVAIILFFICNTGIHAGSYYADYYYIFLNTSPTNNKLISNTTQIQSQTNTYGNFTITGSTLYYKTNSGQNRAGVDSYSVMTGSGLKKVAVVVCAKRPTAIGYQAGDGDNNLFNINNALVTMENLPDNWSVQYSFYDYNGQTQLALPPGITLQNRTSDYVYASAQVYVDNTLKVNSTSLVKDFISLRITNYNDLGDIRAISPDNRYYAIYKKNMTEDFRQMSKRFIK